MGFKTNIDIFPGIVRIACPHLSRFSDNSEQVLKVYLNRLYTSFTLSVVWQTFMIVWLFNYISFFSWNWAIQAFNKMCSLKTVGTNISETCTIQHLRCLKNLNNLIYTTIFSFHKSNMSSTWSYENLDTVLVHLHL